MFGALLKDLSKPFHCLPHDLIIAKLNEYDLAYQHQNQFTIISHRKEKTKINSSYGSWKELLFCVPQGSILQLF